jgi:hypothetical protein
MEDNHTEEVVPGFRLREASLSIEGLETASELPRALFVREVLDADCRVVASAHAEREGDALPVEDAEALGEPVQMSIDHHGVREALLHTAGEESVLLRRLGGAFEVSVAAAPPARARELAEALAEEIRVKRLPRDTRVALAFWSGGSGDGMFGGPEARWRRLALPRFAEVEANYPVVVRERLAELFSQSSGDALPGRLALWHGEPGTGKTERWGASGASGAICTTSPTPSAC